MALFRRTFGAGRMNSDAENRLLPPGEYKTANNIVVYNGEANEGAIMKSLSNKRLTNLNFGPNPIEIGQITYEARQRMYWLVKSDTGSYMCEWDGISQSATFVLQDTRAAGERVFDLNERFLCTGMAIVPNTDPDKELLPMTDNNMEPLCINISRAKTYGVNGFEAEDIYLIKKPPRFAPITQFTNSGTVDNNLEERMLTFFYRYKYLDGEFSAFSSFSNYKFAPKQFKLDYETFENLGMVNAFNGVRIGFDTGDKRVTDIQLVFKNTNSLFPYLVDTFNKADNGWGDNEIRYHNFSANKLYTQLPTRELDRTFDNVPRKALALAMIGNRAIYGNYLENYNLVDLANRKVVPDFTVSLKTRSLTGVNVPVTLSDGDAENDVMTLDLTGIALVQGTRLTFNLSLTEQTYDNGTYSHGVDFILNTDYADATALAADEDFVTFITQGLTNNFLTNYDADPPTDSTLDSTNPFTIVSSTPTGISVRAISLVYQFSDMTTATSYWGFEAETSVIYFDSESASSIKSNRNYEVGLLYQDKWGRKTTVLTAPKNSLFIPQAFSTSKNTLLVNINNPAPAWADSCKLVVKADPLAYQTIYASVFFEDGVYRWIKLDGDSRDKCEEGDILIVKKDITGPLSEVIKVKVLEKKVQEENFISGNNNDEGAEIIEPAGLYMKIKPTNFYIDYTEDQFIVDEGNGSASDGVPRVRVDQLYTETVVGGITTYTDVPIPQGSQITLYFKSYGRGLGPFVFEKTYTVQANYVNFQLWFEDNVTLPLDVPDFSEEYTTIEFVRGTPSGENGVSITGNPDDALFMLVSGIIPGNGSGVSTGRKGYLNTKVTIQIVDGFVIFETEPTPADIDIYYETEQTILIENGFHIGNVQEQNAGQPCIMELNFFNCYTMGNGAESYRVKDAVNKNYLAIDFKPTTTDPNGYKEIRRGTDMTYGETYVESSGVNGLNVFNLSTGNFKDDLDKQYGTIQKLYARDNNVVVMQEEKSGYVLYDKTAIYTADGNAALTSVPGVLGQYQPYAGNRGIGTKPESFSVDEDGRIKYASVKNGSINRLSLHGIEDIVYGMKRFWRDLFTARPNANILSGFDPYLNLTPFSIGDEPVRFPQFGCGAVLNKINQDQPFTYVLQLNDLGGDVVINYSVTGNATISALFNGVTTVASNVTGMGNLTFERDSLVENLVTITITPVGGPISYTLSNNCPVGSPLTIVSVVLSDTDDAGLTMNDRFKWEGSPFINYDELLSAGPVTRFESITGLEGMGPFPVNGSLVTIQTLKDTASSGAFLTSKCNRLGYLITETDYSSATYQDLLDDPDTTFLTVANTGEPGFSEMSTANFLFARSSTDQKLYLIWDYTDRSPVLTDDSANVTLGGSVTIDVLANDEYDPGAVVGIGTPPQYGTAIVNMDGSITYTHDGSSHFEDLFTYTVTQNGCSSSATVVLSIGISCGDSFTASGTTGIYEVNINLGTGTGWAGIAYNAQNVPDRFQIYRSGTLVADSKYVGDSIAAGPPTSYSDLLGPKTLSVYQYDGSAFVDTGVDESFTVVQDDIANNTTEAIDGNGILLFNKTTALPASITLRVIGPIGSTSWDLSNIICPTPEDALVEGSDKFLHGFFNEAGKGGTSKSIKAWLGTSPVKFYTSKIGGEDFSMYNNFTTNPTVRYVNDGVTWWELSPNGTILSTGTL